MNQNHLIKKENIPDVLGELHKAYWEIPFENSDFQNLNQVVKGQYTNARAYRQIGLRLFKKLQALREVYFERQRQDVDIEELRATISHRKTSEFDRRRAQIDVDRKLSGRAYEDKLINDSLHEVNTLYKIHKALPQFDRKSFEAEEQKHFEKRYKRQVMELEGAKDGLQLIGITPETIDGVSIDTDVQLSEISKLLTSAEEG